MAHQSHQWHPPPPPQYTGPLFQNQQQLQNAGQPQFQYNPSAPSPSIRQQYAFPPSVNRSRFDTNHQMPSPSNIVPQYSSAGFNPALFHQFANSNLPPPPPPSFPPLPLPNANFSSFIPPIEKTYSGTQSQYSPLGQPTPQSLQFYQYRIPDQPPSNTEHDSLLQPAKQHEMDDSDRELGNRRGNTVTMSSQPIGQTGMNVPAAVLQRPRIDVAAPASSNRTESVSSYNPPSATPPESGETAALLSNRSGPASAGPTSRYEGRGAFEMRELAKGALLSLAPHNIKFSDLLAEGVDAHLLSQLFEEVGLKTITDAASKSSAAVPFLNTDSKDAQAVPGKTSPTPEVATEAPQAAVNAPAAPAVSVSPDPGPRVRQQNGTSLSTALTATRAADSQSSASPTMERKDVIAAMLAAKMGKPIPRKGSSGTTLLDLSAKVTSVPSTATPDRPATVPQSAPANAISSPSQAVVDEASIKPTPKPKSKAQTELVRQKMEQLKRESAEKAHAQQASRMVPPPSESRSVSGISNGLSTSPQLGLPPKPHSQKVNTASTQLPVASSSTSSTIAGSAPPMPAVFSTSIPGLFMMDSDSDLAFASALLQGTSAFPSATLDPTTTGESALPSETLHSKQTQKPAELDFRTLSRETSNSQIPSKRPLAVDDFDDQDMPPTKQQNSRPTSSRRPEFNDESNDEISEGEIMEIDESSPVSPLPEAAGAQFSPIPPNEFTTRLVADSHAAPKMHQYSSPGDLESNEGMPRPDLNRQTTTTPSKLDIELEAMKKQLREAEGRRKAKQSAPQLQSPASSQVHTPSMPTSSSPVPLSAVDVTPVTHLRRQHSQQSSTAVQGRDILLANGLESKPPVPAVAVDPVQKAKELREKLLRQRMLKQGLPELDKEVQKTHNRQAEAQVRLAQLRREAEKREEEAREARKREQEIMEEVKRLEQQLKMGINGQQQFSQEMKTLEQEMPPQVTPNAEPASNPHPVIIQPLSIATPATEDTGIDTMDDAPQLAENDSESSQEHYKAPEPGDSRSRSEDESIKRVYNNRLVRPSAEAALPTAEEEAAFLQPVEMDESMSEDEGLASPEDNGNHYDAGMSPGDSSLSISNESQMELDSDNDNDNDGSASMSDSDSEDYQPAEPIISVEKFDSVDEDDGEYDPMDAPISGAQSPLPEDDQDDYEPSDVVQALETQTTSATRAQDQTGSSVSNSSASEKEPEHGDDREHGLELTKANTLTTPQELLPSISDTAETNSVPRASEFSASHFTPYQSALSSFKSYRFNSQYTDRVPDGYRSLTYSNTIDPTKPLCPTEAEGGMCNDVECEEQHFRQMSLADEKILVQMSSANDIPDKVQRDRFVAGLKLVIADLRTKHISDFDTVASELAAYRRRFRQEQDPSLAFTSDEL